jgi:hypothetical protein
VNNGTINRGSRIVITYNKGTLFFKGGFMDKRIDNINGKQYFRDRQISRRICQRIKYGSWSSLTPEQIIEKLDNKERRRAIITGYEVVYEEILSKPLGQYCLGVAQEKVANEIIKYAKRIKNDGRRTVRLNRELLKENNSPNSQKVDKNEG